MGQQDASVFSYGNSKQDASPSVWQLAGQRKLKVQVSLHNEKAFSCSPDAEVPADSWTFCSLVVNHASVDVYYNGKKVGNCATNGGIPLVKKDQELSFPAPKSWAPAANAKVKDVWYYPNSELSKEVINAQMTLQQLKDAQELVVMEAAKTEQKVLDVRQAESDEATAESLREERMEELGERVLMEDGSDPRAGTPYPD